VWEAGICVLVQYGNKNENSRASFIPQTWNKRYKMHAKLRYELFLDIFAL
jgi:hypothetical protein